LADKTEVKKFVVEVIKDDDVTVDTLNDDTVLIGENGIFFDSVDVLELIVELENRYGIKIQDNDLIREKLKTFKSLFDFIRENEKK
jgi:acyl carrier protein